MRILEFKINGDVYPLCFTLRAAEAVEERYGSLEECFTQMKALWDEQNRMAVMDEYLWQLHLLMDCGRRHRNAGWSDSKDIPSLEDLKDLFCIGDLVEIQETVIAAITVGSQREVGVSAPKNGEGAAAAQAPNG